MPNVYSLPGGGKTTSLSEAKSAYSATNKAAGGSYLQPTKSAVTTSIPSPSTVKTYSLPDGTTTTNEAASINAWNNYNKPVVQAAPTGTSELYAGGIGRTIGINYQAPVTIVSKEPYTVNLGTMTGKVSPAVATKFFSKPTDLYEVSSVSGQGGLNLVPTSIAPTSTPNVYSAGTPITPLMKAKQTLGLTIAPAVSTATYGAGIIRTGYEKANKFVVDTFIDPNYKQTTSYFGTQFNKFGGDTKASQFSAGAITGAQRYAAERPLDIGVTYATGSLFSKGFAVAGNVASRTGTVGPQILNVGGGALMAGYGVGVALKVNTGKTPFEKGRLFGEESVKFAAFSAGAEAGARGAEGITWGRPRKIRENAFGFETVKYPQVKEVGGKMIPEKDYILSRSLTVGGKPKVSIISKGKPLIESRVRFGELNYRIPKEIVPKIATGYFPQGKIQTRYFEDYAAQIGETQKFDLIKLATKTEFTNSRDISPMSQEIQGLGKKGVKYLDTKFKGGLDYGSRTVEAQLPKWKSGETNILGEVKNTGLLAESRGVKAGEPVAHDIDKQMFYSYEEGINKISEAVPELRKLGENVRQSKTTPTLIEADVKEGGHVFDLHTLGNPEDLQFQDMSMKLGLHIGQKPVKLLNANAERVASKQLSETNIDKLSTILQIKNVPGEKMTLEPPEWQTKSIGDYFTIQKYLLGEKASKAELDIFTKGKEKFKAEGFDVGGKAPKDITATPYKPVGRASIIPSIGLSVRSSMPSVGRSPSLNIGKSSLGIASVSKASISKASTPSRIISKSSTPSRFSLPSVSVGPSKSVSRSVSTSISKASYSSKPSLPSISTASPGSPSGSKSSYSYTPPPPPPSISGPSMPPLYLGLQLFGGKGKKVKFKPKYFASLTATAFNIKGPKPSEFAVSTGLGVRPILAR